MQNFKKVTATILPIFLLLVFSCGENEKPFVEDKNPTGEPPYMELTLSKEPVPVGGEVSVIEEVSVGSANPILITALVIKDAAGKTCNFEATGGTFATTDTISKPSDTILTTPRTVDINGKASVWWFAPDIPTTVDSTVHFSATIDTVKAETHIKVTSVPSVELTTIKLTAEDKISKKKVSVEEVPVASANPILITASVIEDAAGKTCDFEATNGTFAPKDAILKPSDPISKIERTVDINGKVSVWWFAPDIPTTVHFSATIDTVKEEIQIEVTPVPSEIEFIDLPESMGINQTVLFSVRVPSDWVKEAVQVQAPQAKLLKAIGPVSGVEKEGISISPLTDEEGKADVLFVAPDSPQKVIVTASLFGTIQRQEVTIDELSVTSVSIDVSEQTIGIGLETPIFITASVIKDAAGEEVHFKATNGNFENETSNQPRPISETSKMVDINGKASVWWFAPQTPGTVRFFVSIQEITEEAQIEVIPVPPQIEFIDLPESVEIDKKVLFRVSIPSAWARKAVELRIRDEGTLKAVGPVPKDSLDKGSHIFPLTDGNGFADVLFVAPNSPQQVILTASLFGTIKSVLVEIRETVSQE